MELTSGGKPVMAMGGFTGSDPVPTLDEFAAWVKTGAITYYIAGGSQGGGPGGQGTSSQITAWVEAHYKSATIGGETVYLLLQPSSPDPEAYRHPAALLGLRPGEVMLAAAHESDLAAARAAGLATAFIARPLEHGPEAALAGTRAARAGAATRDWDLAATSITEIAGHL